MRSDRGEEGENEPEQPSDEGRPDHKRHGTRPANKKCIVHPKSTSPRQSPGGLGHRARPPSHGSADDCPRRSGHQEGSHPNDSEEVAPAVLLVEDSLIQELERADDRDAAGEANSSPVKYGNSRMRRRMAKKSSTIWAPWRLRPMCRLRSSSMRSFASELRRMMNGSADHSSSAPKIVVQSKT